MKQRTVVALVVGWLLGITTAVVGLVTTDSWYEYRWSPGVTFTVGTPRCRMEIVQTRLEQGWAIVPNQSDPCYMRRPRLQLFDR